MQNVSRRRINVPHIETYFQNHLCEIWKKACSAQRKHDEVLPFMSSYFLIFSYMSGHLRLALSTQRLSSKVSRFGRFKGDTEKVRNALKQFSTEGVVTVDKVDGQACPFLS